MWEVAFELHLSADKAVQCFGGFGYYLAGGEHLQDTRVARICEGTDEIMELRWPRQSLRGLRTSSAFD